MSDLVDEAPAKRARLTANDRQLAATSGIPQQRKIDDAVRRLVQIDAAMLEAASRTSEPELGAA